MHKAKAGCSPVVGAHWPVVWLNGLSAVQVALSGRCRTVPRLEDTGGLHEFFRLATRARNAANARGKTINRPMSKNGNSRSILFINILPERFVSGPGSFLQWPFHHSAAMRAAKKSPSANNLPQDK